MLCKLFAWGLTDCSSDRELFTITAEKEGLIILHLEEHQIKVQCFLRFNPAIQFNSLLPILKISLSRRENSSI